MLLNSLQLSAYAAYTYSYALVKSKLNAVNGRKDNNDKTFT